jgi:hypothetical protein
VKFDLEREADDRTANEIDAEKPIDFDSVNQKNIREIFTSDRNKLAERLLGITGGGGLRKSAQC